MLNTMVIFIFPLRLSFNKKGLILVLAKSRDTRGKYKALITGLVIEAQDFYRWEKLFLATPSSDMKD